ncbi:tRNA (cmo5U34)-methyltransferase [hydrothermal vent metagenome]|uniref:tRNA (Cmo5U34)-methyltransferase n=1 Tax=hydrothermal vent metagenome TaxID=652676 RepID=A0A3B0VPM4_9ZZZZ
MENLNNNNAPDRLFAQQFESVKSFAFDQHVADVFADMIKRSVPGYDSILRSIAMYCMQYAQKNTNIYDLGCSLGAVAVTAAEATKAQNCNIIAIDSSAAMVKKCQQIIQTKNLQDTITLQQRDIVGLTINNASVVVSNFTLQFIPKSLRLEVIQNIYAGLNSGGIFILSEKFKGDGKTDKFLIEHYHAYKKLNGYSNTEIQQKRQALQDVLVPDCIDEITARLHSVGFDNVVKWFQCFNFASFIAVKK